MGVTRDEVVGRSTGKAVLQIERGPVSRFAESVTESSPIYRKATRRGGGLRQHPRAPHVLLLGRRGLGCVPRGAARRRHAEGQPDDGDHRQAHGSGGMVLHGEQEFTYHRPVVVGERLTSEGQIVDLYEKQSGERTMTFLVSENTYRDEQGELVLTARMNLIHRS